MSGALLREEVGRGVPTGAVGPRIAASLPRFGFWRGLLNPCTPNPGHEGPPSHTWVTPPTTSFTLSQTSSPPQKKKIWVPCQKGSINPPPPPDNCPPLDLGSTLLGGGPPYPYIPPPWTSGCSGRELPQIFVLISPSSHGGPPAFEPISVPSPSPQCLGHLGRGGGVPRSLLCLLPPPHPSPHSPVPA